MHYFGCISFLHFCYFLFLLIFQFGNGILTILEIGMIRFLTFLLLCFNPFGNFLFFIQFFLLLSLNKWLILFLCIHFSLCYCRFYLFLHQLPITILYWFQFLFILKQFFTQLFHLCTLLLSYYWQYFKVCLLRLPLIEGIIGIFL